MKRAFSALLMALAVLLLASAAPDAPDPKARVESLLNQLTCPGACTYVVAIIDNHPKERDALLAMDEEALPALSQILLTSERGLRTSMAEVFIDEILSRRRDSEPTPKDSEAMEALLAYTGQEYRPHGPNPDWAKP